jgi:amino acid transporter
MEQNPMNILWTIIVAVIAALLALAYYHLIIAGVIVLGGAYGWYRLSKSDTYGTGRWM